MSIDLYGRLRCGRRSCISGRGQGSTEEKVAGRWLRRVKNLDEKATNETKIF